MSRLYNFLSEDTKGHKFERDLIVAIQTLYPKWKVEGSFPNKYPDVKITTSNKKTFWIEAKLNNNDQFGGNSQWNYNDKQGWYSNTKFDDIQKLTFIINDNAQLKKIIEEFRLFYELKEPIDLKSMGLDLIFNKWLENQRKNKELIVFNNIELIDIIRKNYEQKDCYYVQIKDNLFKLSNKAPKIFQCDSNIPILSSAIGRIRFRWDKSIKSARTTLIVDRWSHTSSPYSFVEANGQLISDEKRIPR